jgi:serine/threonine protein kinase
VPEILKTVGRYEILREVGRGGMAMVYLARQTDLDRFVALKELAAFHASDAAFAQRFLRESRVAGSLSHPNIVTVHDYFEHDGTPYIAMEYVERGSLRPFVGEMSTAQIGGVLEGLLAGLAQAEQHGIVHRDLKPENLMVTSDGRVKIADFGIAKATNQMQTGAFLTATGTTVGTPTYMAPEQAMAQDIGPWTDLYSVGCMAFEMFTGKVPFHDSDAPMAILLRHVNEPIPPVKSIDDSIDAGISDWVEQLLVKDPKERTQSANEAWDEFEELIIGLLGPRWRRGARLSGRTEHLDTPKPLTPAPFDGAPADEAPSDEFQSFAWGEAVEDTPGPATPPPKDMPARPLEPGSVDVPTGPPTPPPLTPVQESGFVTFGAPAPAEEEPAAPPAETPPPPAEAPVDEAPAPADEAPAPADEALTPADETPASPVDEATGFVTFGAPAPPADAAPPEDAAAPPVAPPPAAGAPPVADEPVAPPPDEPAVEEAPRFETYVAPPPPRPPTDEPPVARPTPPTDEPPVSAPAPPVEPSAPAPLADEPPAVAPPPTGPPPVEPPPSAPPPATPEPVASAAVEDPSATVMPEVLKRGQEPSMAAPTAPWERTSKVFPIALGGGLVAAIVAGVLIGGGGGDSGGGGGEEGASTPVTPAEAGALKVKVPADYAALSSAPALPGLELADGAAYAPGGKDGGRAVAFGQATANDSTLLPAEFRGAAGLESGKVPERIPVKLGPDGLQAYRYEGLKPAGIDRQVTVYASPTSAGVATVACLAPPADAAAFKADCEAIANTLQLTSGDAFPVGPDAGYAKTLGATFAKLDKQVAKGRQALGKDKATFRQQGAAARDVQTAYAAASKQLKDAEISPADRAINGLIVERLRDAAAAWKKAAAAAVKKDKRGFDRSEAGIKQAQQQLAQTVAGLEKAGYDIAG